jgi:hypothetical protein
LTAAFFAAFAGAAFFAAAVAACALFKRQRFFVAAMIRLKPSGRERSAAQT